KSLLIPRNYPVPSLIYTLSLHDALPIFNESPDDFIVTSACVAGWLYDDADEIWLKIAKHFGNNFFLEVQNHNTDKQKALNKHILDRKSTRLNSSHVKISYAVFCLKKQNK